VTLPISWLQANAGNQAVVTLLRTAMQRYPEHAGQGAADGGRRRNAATSSYAEAEEARAAAQLERTPIVSVAATMPIVEHHFDRDSTAIGQLSASISRSPFGQENYGLTVMGPRYRFESTADIRPAPNGRLHYFLTRLDVTATYRDAAVYVAQEYPTGGRRHRIIIDHERDHVRLFEQKLREHLPRVERQVRRVLWPVPSSSWNVESRAAGDERVGAEAGAAIAPLRSAFGRELQAAHNDLDSVPRLMPVLRSLYSLDPALRSEHQGTRIRYAPLAGELFVDGVRESDVLQGQIADCYLAAALAAVARTDPERIVAMIRPAGGSDFTVRLFVRNSRGGGLQPRAVTVDPVFPMRPASSSPGQTHPARPVYARPGQRAPSGAPELWVLLVEKAYAMLHGGYDVIGEGGQATRALETLTGVPARSASDDSSMWARLMQAVRSDHPAVVVTQRETARNREALRNCGLAGWHTYPVIGAWVERGERLIQLRNVWGERGVQKPGMSTAPEFTIPFGAIESVIGSVTVGGT
jgi:hypothetical protein